MLVDNHFPIPTGYIAGIIQHIICLSYSEETFINTTL